MNIFIPDNEIFFTFVRSSGPGGQNVNKVNSKAVLHWNISKNKTLKPEIKERFQKKFAKKINSYGELIITSDNYREQQRNIEKCYDKLRTMIFSVLQAAKERKTTKPSRGSVEKRLSHKKKRADLKKTRQAGKRFSVDM